MVEMSKFLNTAATSSSQLVKSSEIIKTQSTSESRSFGSNLKVWQLALLIGESADHYAFDASED